MRHLRIKSSVAVGAGLHNLRLGDDQQIRMVAGPRNQSHHLFPKDELAIQGLIESMRYLRVKSSVTVRARLYDSRLGNEIRIRHGFFASPGLRTSAR